MQTDIPPRPAEVPPWDTDPITAEAGRCPPAVALWTILGVSAALWWGGIRLVQMAV